MRFWIVFILMVTTGSFVGCGPVQKDSSVIAKDEYECTTGIHYDADAKDSMDKMNEVMNRFGIKSLIFTPADNEAVEFFKDVGKINGKTYVLEGVEFVNPCQERRCPYAKSYAVGGGECPEEVELALHVSGKFRYALWGGRWIKSKTSMTEMIPITNGDDVVGFACPELWRKGSKTEKIDLPLPNGMWMMKITPPDGKYFYAVFETEDYKVPVVEMDVVDEGTRFIQKPVVKEIQRQRVKVIVFPLN